MLISLVGERYLGATDAFSCPQIPSFLYEYPVAKWLHSDEHKLEKSL